MHFGVNNLCRAQVVIIVIIISGLDVTVDLRQESVSMSKLSKIFFDRQETPSH